LYPGDFTYAQWATFMMALVRTSGLIAMAPFLGSPNIPAMAKAGLSLLIALLLTPLVTLPPASVPTQDLQFLLFCAGELLIGMILGLALRLLLTSVQIMGQLVGFQMGFAVANVVDPMSGTQVSLVAQFAYLMTLLVFLGVGGHLTLIKALADSFTLVPPGDFSFSQGLFTRMMDLAAMMFSLSVRIGAPLIGALLMTQVTMGFLAKTVPQMNILMVGFPITISIGMIFLSLVLTLLVPIMENVFGNLGPLLSGLLKAM
jgi:flagellar biosynthesis protein FliR